MSLFCSRKFEGVEGLGSEPAFVLFFFFKIGSFLSQLVNCVGVAEVKHRPLLLGSLQTRHVRGLERAVEVGLSLQRPDSLAKLNGVFFLLRSASDQGWFKRYFFFVVFFRVLDQRLLHEVVVVDVLACCAAIQLRTLVASLGL